MDKAKVKHAIGIHTEDLLDFAIDPTQDLLVILYQPANDSAHLECRSFSSHRAHPLAALPLLLFPLEAGPAPRLSIHIADDIVAISFPCLMQLLLFNWRMGIPLTVGFETQMPIEHALTRRTDCRRG